MSQVQKFKCGGLALTTQVLVPISVQACVIGLVLTVAFGNVQLTLLTAIACLIWLGVGRIRDDGSRLDFFRLRVQRRLWVQVAGQLGTVDPESYHDRATAELLHFRPSIEADSFTEAAVANGLRSAMRGLLSTAVQVYLLVVGALTIIGSSQ